MGNQLEGKRVAITGPRKTEELGRMVQKLGGIPLARPAQGTMRLDDEAACRKLLDFTQSDWDWMIFTTGMGLEAMHELARRLELEERFIAKLRSARLAARGYKAVGALKKLGVEPEVRDLDGTSAGLVRAFQEAKVSLAGQRVALQLHGDPAPALVGMLEEMKASYEEILPYIHTPPCETELERLLGEIMEGTIDAVLFTSGAQVRFPFAYARARGLTDALLEAFERSALAVAVGKFTAECLREEGVRRIVAPSEERMGYMVQELAAYYSQQARPITPAAEG